MVVGTQDEERPFKVAEGGHAGGWTQGQHLLGSPQPQFLHPHRDLGWKAGPGLESCIHLDLLRRSLAQPQLLWDSVSRSSLTVHSARPGLGRRPLASVNAASSATYWDA